MKEKLNLLALETSSSQRSVALLQVDEVNNITIVEDVTSENSTQSLLHMIDNILKKLNLDKKAINCIVFGQGPGSFTGTRLSCSLAHGMSLTLKIPILSIESHLAMAEASKSKIDQIIVVASDAKMNEIYLSAYQVNPKYQFGFNILQSTILVACNDLVPWLRNKVNAFYKFQKQPNLVLVGNAWSIENINSNLNSSWLKTSIYYPSAKNIAILGKEIFLKNHHKKQILKDLMPLYIRNKVAFTIAEQKLGNTGNPKIVPFVEDKLKLLPQIMTEKDLNEVYLLEQEDQINPWTKKI
ncbi:MAG: tRNA (adenosine(37)-N6)-threonylcarbamoyltransferase complex dimerization subunit type 1 TsaB [Bordetella sp.]|nr:MAG: tRNA (adenosine(37)-N6)-threonylcarbamoyltransferase complex dimerization subunit type 1 TsaB [Bordetella sp.]